MIRGRKIMEGRILDSAKCTPKKIIAVFIRINMIRISVGPNLKYEISSSFVTLKIRNELTIKPVKIIRTKNNKYL